MFILDESGLLKILVDSSQSSQDFCHSDPGNLYWWWKIFFFLIIKDEVQHSFKSIWTCLYDDCEIEHTILAMYLLVEQNMAFLLNVIHGWRQLHFCNVEECQNKPR